MDENNSFQRIDVKLVLTKIWSKKRIFYITMPLAFVLSSLYIICIPRSYSSSTKMAPEVDNSMHGGTLGSIASTFGVDISEAQSSDAITPMLYPDLMEDNGFVTELFNIHIKTQDGKINTTYYNYLKKYQKAPWWAAVGGWAKHLLKKTHKETNHVINPYILTKDENDVANAIRNNVKFSTDKKTGVITINVTEQDPLVCKIIADSVREHLKQFISSYRTSKARTDFAYYKKLVESAKYEYEKSRQLYGSYSDANTEVLLESFKLKQEDLENDMQLKFNTYSSLNTQLQAAKAKVQERTPVFTLIQGSSVPLKPSGPKRMIFVLIMLILTFIGTGIYTLNDILRG